MNDFFKIDKFEEWVYQENEKTIKFFESEIKSESIVVTHYLPSEKSIALEYKNSSLNNFFLCDIENIIQEKQPKLYCHGHTHSSFDYQIGSTKVICNPYGYHKYDVNKSFDCNKIINI